MARAIKNGMLPAVVIDEIRYVTKTDATRWSARRCPDGETDRAWIAIDEASVQYDFTVQEIEQHIAQGRLNSRSIVGPGGTAVLSVGRNQCAVLRETVGFTEAAASRRVGVSVEVLRDLIDGVAWRGADGIPLSTVQAAIKRRQSRAGFSIKEAAALLEKSVQWVTERVDDGTVRLYGPKWSADRLYLPAPMIDRLRASMDAPDEPARLAADWLRLSEAALDAGVSAGTLAKWASAGEVVRQRSQIGWRYERHSLRVRARLYWLDVRRLRAIPPAWLEKEYADTRGREDGKLTRQKMPENAHMPEEGSDSAFQTFPHAHPGGKMSGNPSELGQFGRYLRIEPE